MEKRKFSRENFRTEAIIRHDGLSFTAEVENLSLKGLFVKTANKIPINDEVDVTMFFKGSEAQLSFSLKGTVVRIEDDGIGLNFRKIDIDSLGHTGEQFESSEDIEEVTGEKINGMGRNTRSATASPLMA